jgi:transposase InsO family protein
VVPKRHAVLRELGPQAGEIGMLLNPDSPIYERVIRDVQEAARQNMVQLHIPAAKARSTPPSLPSSCGRPARLSLLPVRFPSVWGSSSRRGSALPAPGSAAREVELERLVGQQRLELDFFRQALRHVGTVGRSAAGRGASPCSGSSVARMCELCKLSRASYYRQWRVSAPRREEAALRDVLQRLALAHRRYGYRRLTVLLRREGFAVNHKRVLRLMGEDNLLCLRHRPFVPATTQSDHDWEMVPNLLRRLRPSACDKVWVADITYIRLQEGFVYLAVVLDAFSRKVVGWTLDDHLRASLAVEALQRSVSDRRPPRGLIHHSDRGVQYACAEYRMVLAEHGLQASMSRVGNPYDNAKAESFMATLKREEVDGRQYRDLAEARAQIGAFIDTVYNVHRLHSALGYRSPLEFESHRAGTSAANVAAADAPAITPNCL